VKIGRNKQKKKVHNSQESEIKTIYKKEKKEKGWHVKTERIGLKNQSRLGKSNLKKTKDY